jgi:hypothetical protein
MCGGGSFADDLNQDLDLGRLLISMKPEIEFRVPIILGELYILDTPKFINKASALIEATIISPSTQKYLRKRLLLLYQRSFVKASEKTENSDYMSDIDCDVTHDNVYISVVTNQGIHHTLSKGVKTSISMLEQDSDNDDDSDESESVMEEETIVQLSPSINFDELIERKEEGITMPQTDLPVAEDAITQHSCPTEPHHIEESIDEGSYIPVLPTTLAHVVPETTLQSSVTLREVTITNLVDGEPTSQHVETYNVCRRRGKQKYCTTQHIDKSNIIYMDGHTNMCEKICGHSTSNFTTTVPYAQKYRNFSDGTQGFILHKQHVLSGKVIHMHMQCTPKSPSTAQSQDLTHRSLILRGFTTRI